MTECTQSSFWFASHFWRQVVARFDGGPITSDAGALLLRPVEQRTGILRQFATCFRDYRRPALVEHTVGELVRQRVYGLALGYEDLNDHDQLRQDPLLALLSGKSDLEGEHRRREQDRGKAGAGKSTLNRLELTSADATERTRYKKIVLRGDSGFCRDAIMSWCEQNRVGYVFGLAKNERLRKKVRQPMKQARRQWEQPAQPARGFTEFRYRTRESWSRARRVIAKAEYLDKGENPRFVVTSFRPQRMEARPLYEEFYCARGRHFGKNGSKKSGRHSPVRSRARKRPQTGFRVPSCGNTPQNAPHNPGLRHSCHSW